MGVNQVYHVGSADTNVIAPIADGIDGRVYGLVEDGAASRYTPVAPPLVAAWSVAHHSSILSFAFTGKTILENANNSNGTPALLRAGNVNLTPDKGTSSPFTLNHTVAK
jgi:hypothetical protein